MRVLVVIPARLLSTRLPEKLLLRETGKCLVQHTWEAARGAGRADRVVIAADHERILEAAREFGAEALLTSPEHPSGTDRVAEVARVLEERGEVYELVVNVQGDEPELDPAAIDELVALMEQDPEAGMGTLAEPLVDPAEVVLPQVVKVVRDRRGRALYFSRAPIPSGAEPGGQPAPLRHLGIYAYRPALLQELCRLEPAPLELAEKLEQLRALWHGHAIQVGVLSRPGARGIDTRADYDAFLARHAAAR
ncbi:MAG: 3-deoxy-manno-octulosonate cytidylyltransferase [Planctomycetota bacterium]